MWSSRSVIRQNVCREALLFRMEVKDRHCPVVVAVGVKLEAAGAGSCRGGWEQP